MDDDIDVVNAAGALRDVPPEYLPALLLREAGRASGAAVGIYVIDVDGSCLLLLAGAEDLPEHIAIPGAVGPELPLECVEEAAAAVAAVLPGASTLPIVLGDRALGAIVARGPVNDALVRVADQAALALELGSGYTDVVHATRRRRRIDPAAEIQQNLLPPRLARVRGGNVAGGVLPGYDVGGDFLDYASNQEGLWLAVGDGVGKGNNAAALASVTIGALRAARRSDAGLRQAAALMHETVYETGGTRVQFVTAIVAFWDIESGVLEWVNCGHPPPLVIGADGLCAELSGAVTYPLGLFRRDRELPTAKHTLAPGDRLLLYSDGISERRSTDGSALGVEGIKAALGSESGASAARTVRTLQNVVNAASELPLRDDATLLALALDG